MKQEVFILYDRDGPVALYESWKLAKNHACQLLNNSPVTISIGPHQWEVGRYVIKRMEVKK